MEKTTATKVQDTKENLEICLTHCGTCPSYPGVEGEALFCARGASNSPANQMGCNCGSCEVFNKYECKGGYFCINGPCE